MHASVVTSPPYADDPSVCDSSRTETRGRGGGGGGAAGASLTARRAAPPSSLARSRRRTAAGADARPPRARSRCTPGTAAAPTHGTAAARLVLAASSHATAQCECGAGGERGCCAAGRWGGAHDDVEGLAPAEEHDGRLRMPIVLDQRQEERHELCRQAVRHCCPPRFVFARAPGLLFPPSRGRAKRLGTSGHWRTRARCGVRHDAARAST